MCKGTVVVGMSGGVDSSVVAYLLKQQGYKVIGVTMLMWSPENRPGDAGALSDDVADAKRVADILEIPHIVLDFREDFRASVVDYFVNEYLQGRTPNPCIVCNRQIKWAALLDKAHELGADYVATGHYARIDKLPNGRYAVKNSVTARKDQTYVLYDLTQEQLAATMMPIGGYDKEEIRRIAADLKLPIADKKDSQDICFIKDGDYAGFIERYMSDSRLCSSVTDTYAFDKPGEFILSDGTVLGEHKGIIHYTIGQRKGLGISYTEPLFVNKIDIENNQVVLGSNEDTFTDSLICNHVNMMAVEAFEPDKEYIAKIRYSHAGSPCHITRLDDDRLRLDFSERVRAVTPGQGVVIYDGEYVAGGGTIIE